ncbi:bifunctional phosphopantothenoylcysteine decarboxylase/phosphopantothenate--cysteine ligase CoaBC [Enemella evansiae]|uniref:bifunctional phosphopantothenoylcysteine decarboxylase/phosphopantothenate--cysteine ligase CoaBC n=1 Tax=Enemella evansiae TaxID=2016499 RepID=UPI000B972757|nr:bifunctional phosphopantothenoylcysteine decarboxylase/phosphopantothenate--cysteine ligase CoaBC [Enemella evansiae]OYO15600.1 bifunctional phosphopantothenoylcysteine decarboxylase/phosphopantothenate--cysteine ligase CoaBC [Enemella evansiae]TDO93152.1 phosphopantothenate-cysteine ligase /phosphopantothenoylcysteine decarboxylase [Enemella evansiae]
MSRIVLGVAGGIAAYKACELLRRLTEGGHDVTVVPTANALEFVGATTWAALSGNPVHTGVFTDAEQVPHVRLGQQVDLVVVAPATADLLARAATGRADDLLTNVLLTARCPVLMAPAMHTEMWLHPATAANVATLRERGVVVLDPASGRLTGADTGPGRLPDAIDIHAVAASLLDDPGTVTAAADRDLEGVRLVVATGGTREHLDPVRFLGNSSSGLMGLSIARAAALRGAEVTVVAAHVEHPLPSGASIRRIVSTGDLDEAMTELAPSADVIVMAVAAADFTPTEVSEGKIKKADDSTGLSLDLVQTPDVLKHISHLPDRDPGQVIVGFAAETAGDQTALLELGQAKLARKGCDLLVLNDVSAGAVFGAADNHVLLLGATPGGGAQLVAEHSGSKPTVAHRILDAVRERRRAN